MNIAEPHTHNYKKQRGSESIMKPFTENAGLCDKLQTIPLLKDLDQDALNELAEQVTTRHYKKHALVVNQGDTTDSLYIICEGSVRVFRDDERGREITLNILTQGEYFGEFALLSDEPRIAHVETLEPTTVITISKHAFMHCFGQRAEVAWRISRDLVNKIRATTIEISDLALLDVYGRVANMLLKNAAEHDGAMVVEGLTHQEIANRISASREMVSRIMKDLRRGNYIRNEGRKIILEKVLPTRW